MKHLIKKKNKEDKFQSDFVFFFKIARKQLLKHLTIPYSLGSGFFPLDLQILSFMNPQHTHQAFSEQDSDP